MISKTFLLKEIEIVDNLPAIYIQSIDSIVLGDLHLGYEGVAAEQGIFIPKTQFKEETRMIKKIIEERKAKRIILNGDIKHELSETSYHEFREVVNLLKFLKTNFDEVIVIKGNHDNYIYYVTNRVGVKLYEEFLIGNYLFTHGHQNISLKCLKADTLILNHEHPVIALYDEVGAKEVIKCFLFGKIGLGNILVLPAFSTLSYGTEMNLVSKEELLSPILKSIDLDELEAIGVDEEIGILKFGKLGKLKL